MVRNPSLQLIRTGDTAAKRTRKPRIAVVIPVFNEQANIEQVLEEVESLRLSHLEWNLLPIVVNDGSSDRTRDVLNAVFPRVRMRVVELPINLGIGGAVQTGFRVAEAWGADAALQLDGDGQHPAEEIPKLIEPVLEGRADVVVGSRYVPGAGGIVSSRVRRMGTGLFSRLLQVLVGAKIADVTSGFRAFSFEALDLLARDYPDDYPEVQAYVPLMRRGFRVIEVPVKMRPREEGKSSITPVLAFYYMVKVAFGTVMEVLREHPEVRGRWLEDTGEAPRARAGVRRGAGDQR